MPERDTSRPGLIANLVLAALWLGLAVWTLATPDPATWKWLLIVGYLVPAAGFAVIGVRRHRSVRDAKARRDGDDDGG